MASRVFSAMKNSEKSGKKRLQPEESMKEQQQQQHSCNKNSK